MKSNLILPLLFSTLSVSFMAQANTYNDDNSRDYNLVALGFEHINYQESITNLLGDISPGQDLKTDTTVINPIHRTRSYLTINDDFGVYVNTSSTLAQNPEKEEWKLGSFNEIQVNDYSTHSSELELKLAYHLTPSSQLIIGSSFNTLDFNRSNFVLGENGEQLNTFLKDDMLIRATAAGLPQDEIDQLVEDSGLKLSAGAVTESSVNLDLIVGYAYESEFSSNGNLQWYAGIEATLPIYYRVINSKDAQLEHTGSILDGYGLQSYSGLRWFLTENLSFDVGLRSMFKKRNRKEIELDNGLTNILPDVTFSNLQYFLGVTWR